MENRSLPDSLSAFIDQRRTPDSDWSAQVVNRTDPEPVQTMAEGLYDGLDIETSETELDGLDDDLFLVLRDGRVVASSPLGILKDTLLMVNVDRYRTGTQLVGEIDVPDVILELSDTVFSLEALGQQTGTLRSSFQRLSRLDDERGTLEFYEQLGQTEGVETHVYGVPDWEPPAELGVNCHEVVDDEIRESWVVVYRTETAQSVAMVAIKTGRNTWDGYWTFDTDEIRAIDRYITQTF